MSLPTQDSSPWAAIYVKHRHEKSVALGLEARGILSFLPLYSLRHVSGKVFDLPLFPGYVFCRLNGRNSLMVRSTPGVFKIVRNDREPAIISESEIDNIRQTINSKQNIRPWPYTTIGEEVCLQSGPLRGVRGVVVDDAHDRWLVLSVHVLKRSVAVKVERARIAEDLRESGVKAIEHTENDPISTAGPR